MVSASSAPWLHGMKRFPDGWWKGSSAAKAYDVESRRARAQLSSLVSEVLLILFSPVNFPQRADGCRGELVPRQTLQIRNANGGPASSVT